MMKKASQRGDLRHGREFLWRGLPLPFKIVDYCLQDTLTIAV